jgi:hypothetical protein
VSERSRSFQVNDEGVTCWPHKGPERLARPGARGCEMRRFLLVSVGLLAAMVVGSAAPALADSGVIKGVFIEDFQGTMPLDDPTFTACLGYEGQIFEDRDGVFSITVHTRGAMAGAFHVEG